MRLAVNRPVSEVLEKMAKNGDDLLKRLRKPIVNKEKESETVVRRTRGGEKKGEEHLETCIAATDDDDLDTPKKWLCAKALLYASLV